MPGEIQKRSTGGRPRREISPEVQNIICTLIATGESDRRVARIVRIEPKTWKAAGSRDKEFAAKLERAATLRNGALATTIRESMVAMIKKGHPWWAKLAIHNFRTLLKDPDLAAALKLKRQDDKGVSGADLLEADPALASASPPPGAVPAME